MRRIIAFLTLTLLALPLCTFGAEPEKVEVNSLSYYIDKEDMKAEVTKVIGSGAFNKLNCVNKQLVLTVFPIFVTYYSTN
jgi:hypothetical protein